jgi:hypothetical protein
MRKVHPYLMRKCFPADWAQVEILKQYLRNYRRYNVKKGHLESKRARKAREAASSDNEGLPKIEMDGEEEE